LAADQPQRIVHVRRGCSCGKSAPAARKPGSEQTSSLPWLVDHGQTMLIIAG